MTEDFLNLPRDSWKKEDYKLMDKFSLAGKSGFITGGAGGIGRNVAAAWAEAGANIALVDLKSQKEKLDETVKELSSRYETKIIPLYCDVTNEEEVKQLKEDLLKAFGTIDIAMINAGVNMPGDDLDIPYEIWKKTIDINLNGAFLTTQMAYQVMREHNHGGSIVVTSSISGHHTNFIAGGPSPVLAYGSTKAGVSRMAAYLAAALAPYQIRVNVLSPGYTWTDIFDGRINQEGADAMLEVVPMKRFGLTEEIQGAALFLASDASSYITGINLPVDGGYGIY